MEGEPENRGNSKYAGPTIAIILSTGLVFITGIYSISNRIEKRMGEYLSNLPTTNIFIGTNQKVKDISEKLTPSDSAVWKVRKKVIERLNPSIENLSEQTMGTNEVYSLPYDSEFMSR